MILFCLVISVNTEITVFRQPEKQTTTPPTTVIASEQSERGNLPTTENAPNNNNDKAVGWASQPTTTPTIVDYTVKSNLRFDGGLETHPTVETIKKCRVAFQATTTQAALIETNFFRQPETPRLKFCPVGLKLNSENILRGGGLSYIMFEFTT